jgi:hypothetical protein
LCTALKPETILGAKGVEVQKKCSSIPFRRQFEKLQSFTYMSFKNFLSAEH